MEDIKVINESGTVKWFSKTLVDNVNFMKREGWKVFESPVSMDATAPTESPVENIKVANFAGAKQGRKPKK